jgi:hypothetical protein
MRALLIIALATTVVEAQAAAPTFTCPNRSLRPLSLRLDAARNAFLWQLSDKGQLFLYSVQDGDSPEKCTVLDRLVTRENGATVFEYECSAQNRPGKAVVALTSPRQPIDRRVLKAWVVDEKSLHFVPVKAQVRCTHEGYAGNDDGSDLLGRARERGKTQGLSK